MTTKVIILCGGQGTRIRDVADNIPKPMIPIGDKPIVWHIMNRYAKYGLNEFILCLGYRGWSIKEYFLNYHAFTSDLTVSLGPDKQVIYHDTKPHLNWKVTLAETGEATQTGGRIWNVRHYLQESDIFCMTYGDGVADIDIDQLIIFHRSHGRTATVTGVRPPGRFGVMQIQQEGTTAVVGEFQEKPQISQGIINGGFFVFDHRIWDYLTDDPTLIFEQAPLASLAKAGQLAMYEHSGFWQPMDTYREWKLLNELWASGNAPWVR